jgi:hypothetical protein
MDGEVLVASPFQRCDVLCVLCMALEWFGDTIPLDESLHRHLAGMELFDAALETAKDSLWRPSLVEAVETLLLDVFDERRR